MKTETKNTPKKLRIPSVVKVILLMVVVFTAAGVLYISTVRPGLDSKNVVLSDNSAFAGELRANTPGIGGGLPALVDLGANKCIPCRMMAPMLEELKKEYRGKLNIIFLDVWKDPKLGREYGIFTIPTQIFFDENGKELYRHIGYYPKEEILHKWEELGYDFQ